MRMVDLQTSKMKSSTGRQAFNPLQIVKIAEANNGNTFLDILDHGSSNAITAWTIYEPFEQVLAKINAALEGAQ